MKKIIQKNKKILALLISMIVFLVPNLSSADTVKIENNVQSKASTGGNSSQSIKDGESSIYIKVETNVNGENVQTFERKEEGVGDIEAEVFLEFSTNTIPTILNNKNINATSGIYVENAEKTNAILEKLNNLIKQLIIYVQSF